MGKAGQDRTIWAAVRTHDHDRYLTVLFAPEPARRALMALYAFNIDVARIPEVVSEPMLGEIRLQWWREALQTVSAGATTGNPVADALGKAIGDYDLPMSSVQEMIDARVFDISGEPMPDRQALKVYLQKTTGNVFALAAHILTGDVDAELAAVARTAGFCWGLTGLLRMLPLHLSRGRFYLPVSHFRDHGADPEQLSEGRADEKALRALLGLRDEAREAFGHTRAGVHGMSRKTSVAFLPCALVPLYLRALERQAERPLEGVADIAPLKRLSRLTWAALRGRLE